MRRVVVAAFLMATIQAAQAADLPDLTDLPILRGPVREGLSTPSTYWGGFYVGGQAAYGSADMNFAGSNDSLTAKALGPNNILQDVVSSLTQAGGKISLRQAAFGGFVGYNRQWEDVVLGVEANYMHGTFSGSQGYVVPAGTYVTPFADGRYHNVGLSSSRSITIKDAGTLRVRAGYVAGYFLPYAFAGVALGYADLSGNVTISDRSDTTLAGAATGPLTTYSASDGISGKMLYGYSAGLGTEAMLFGGLFARAEWEYIRFVNAGADVNINTVRGGLGYKF